VQTTPNKELFAIQKRIDGAWKHLFYVDDESHGYDANAVVHEPGGGFKWSFSVTREGLSTEGHHICSDIVPGKYRFVYFWMNGSDEQSGKAVAVQFTVKE